MVTENGEITMKVFSKSTKLPVHWSSKIPVRYKGNAITEELNQAKRTASETTTSRLKLIRIKLET